MTLEILFVKLLFLVSLTSSQVASRPAVVLAEQNYNSSPTNLIANESSQFVLLDNKTNIIPGWSYQGTVWYVIARNSSLTGDGNSLQLGPSGMISYTFYCDVQFVYFLTFTLAPSSPYCANNAIAVNVSDPRFSKVFFYKESLGKETWQNHAYSVSGYRYVTLQIQSVAASSHGNIACWPIIDNLLLTGIDQVEIRENNGDFNRFWNSGFEVGPSPLASSPQGRRAVELISASGNPSGIAYNATAINGIRQYILEFIMGDAGDSCVGDFTVVVQVGSMKWNFMRKSNGAGSSKKYSVKFQNWTYSTTDVVPISFVSYTETRTSDHQELCGPVIDAMYLGIYSGLRSTRLPSGLAIFVLVVTFFFLA
ncbi:hypothetical protein CTI12_AA457500 [Artemisia annua]|uniref:DUF642 domain-containing protein n=1 Tax=Artemisia annua TaxID=35608 RepID=A0A2U1LL48_ARTAN|nr:hypothetical protein CTI12_AA457500 [Artemisia annua]